MKACMTEKAWATVSDGKGMKEKLLEALFFLLQLF